MTRFSWAALHHPFRPNILPLRIPSHQILSPRRNSIPFASLSRRRTSRRRSRAMKVAVVGCAHGELDSIYSALRETERARNISIDLVICPGDFQAIRNSSDLQCMACPPKYRDMGSFWKYYSGQSVAPYPTIFVGGNHEASNYMQEIPMGGLVASNMYYLGRAGVVWYRGLRIAGLSGVYTEHNYQKKRVERPPYPRNQIKSVYHTRKEDVERLKRLKRKVDLFISHDWPRGITEYGNLEGLLKAKPFLRKEITEGSFGNPGASQLLHLLEPRYWFSAHMHVKFAALVGHEHTGKETRFLALDKALPKREFVQVLDIEVDSNRQETWPQFPDREARGEEAPEFCIDLDAEWLAILKTEAKEQGRDTSVTDEEMGQVADALKVGGVRSFVWPLQDFEKTGPVHDPNQKMLPMPSSVELQGGALKLLEALELKKEDWLPEEEKSGQEQIFSVGKEDVSSAH